MSGTPEQFAVESPVLGEAIGGYVVEPAGEPVALIYLLHGRGGTAADWLPALAALALPVVAVLADAPRSERASWYVDSAADDGRPVERALIDDLLPAFDARFPESEHRDGRVRFPILEGGSACRAEGSDWYFDGGVQEPDVSAKLVLPGAGLARSSQIGLRCAVTLR